MNDRAIDFEKGNGLVPVIVQDADTGRVLMMGYMNREALNRTRETRMVTFFSRSRRKLWTKGETSGNYLELIDLAIDCDGDTLLAKARPHGPTCHTGNESCFDLEPGRGWQSLPEAVGGLTRVIADRKDAMPEASYTADLIRRGVDRMARGVGEEALEVMLAATSGEQEALVQEVADLFYHTMVLLAGLGVTPDRVALELSRRKK
ncbi:MAG: bifunctional phosphoribosyl-AMP cyclohydrolase/phosphoribosyl-ATP diphosphatase HisIE [Deltaproteobacteria bacterium]|nr:bifunctional phosphoribosyl-AMP cyclohydrolase/phosphoribosyl-ATP diphosphatase HisIE [Deltaproteobacteria bacterium]